jgi:hypothetical protein
VGEVLLKRLKAFVFAFASWRFLFLFLKRLNAFIFAHGDWKFLSLLLKRLKVFVPTFECWRFLLFLLIIEGFCSYFWMLKVLIFTFLC